MLRYSMIIAAFLLLFQTGRTAAESVPTLKLADGPVSVDGHVRITWDPQTGTNVELQQSKNKDFTSVKTVYRGSDEATFISGLNDGTYYYRIRHVDGVWSDPVMVTVNHHSLRLAIILFSLGAVVFALTVFIVVKGAFSASVD